jgi:SHS2 domain-containing protein
VNTTSPEQIAQARMALAEALTDTSRSLDRARRRIEATIMALENIHDPDAVQTHIQNCRQGIVLIEQLNNTIRKMMA